MELSDCSRSQRRCKRSSNLLFSPPVPIKMSETLYDSFDKLGKKQNKEQVPPAGEPHNKKKPSANKASKTSSTSNTVTRETHKNLAEAFKAVSKAEFSPLLPLLLANFILFIKSSGCLSQRIPFDDDCLYNGL